jgi:hypothetical protein
MDQLLDFSNQLQIAIKCLSVQTIFVDEKVDIAQSQAFDVYINEKLVFATEVLESFKIQKLLVLNKLS